MCFYNNHSGKVLEIKRRKRVSGQLAESIKELYLKGKSVKEIAVLFGISVSTVYSVLKRAKVFINRRGKLSSTEELLLDLNGFIKLQHNRKALNYVDAEIINIRLGVGMVGRKYSSYSFFGVKPYRLTFLVKDLNSFRYHIARMLLGMFYEKNPNPSRDLRKSFTHFLHSYSLD